MIVTASKLEEPLSQASNAVTVVTQQDITRRQTTDLFEQLREVPGFTFVQTGSRGALTSLFTRGGESDHNLILIDGVKVNRAGAASSLMMSRRSAWAALRWCAARRAPCTVPTP